MAKNPIFRHLGPRYHFLTTRKLISGQNYYRSTQKLKKFDFFAKIFFHQPANIGKNAEISKCVFSNMVLAISLKFCMQIGLMWD